MTINSLANQEFIKRLKETLHANIGNENFGVSELAHELGMSRSNLHRKIRKVFKISASRFIRKERLNHAKELIKQPSCTVSEAGYKSGFSNTSYFIKCFQEQYGYSPGKLSVHEKQKAASYNDRVLKGRKKCLVPFISFILFCIISLSLLKLLDVSLCDIIRTKDERSIALLPFKYEGQDSEEAHYISGTMVSVLNELATNKNMDVRSLFSVKKYRDTNKTPKKIARELNVKYLINAVGQVYDNNITITIQLIDACSDQILLSKTFSTQLMELSDIDNMQSKIALTITKEINEELTSEYKNE